MAKRLEKGDRVRFAHMKDDTVGHRIEMVNLNGMIELDTFPGEFAPHLFEKLP